METERQKAIIRRLAAMVRVKKKSKVGEILRKMFKE